jgi:small multidrug resistance pump
VVTWILLAAAIAAELTGTVALKLSDGFTKLPAATLVVVGYLTSFVLLSRVLKRGLALGVAYAVWSAIGIGLIVVVDALWFGHRMSPVQIGGLVLIITGVLALQVGGSVTA